MKLGDIAPDFEAETTVGQISFHRWLGDSWGLLFSHPKDFTPVCTTELGAVERLMPEFEQRGVKVLGLSMDSIENHTRWAEDIAETQGAAPNFPIIADTDLSVAKLYDMLPADFGDSAQGQTAQDLFTVRSAFLIGPDKRILMMMTYPMSTGRNMSEILRVVDSIQLTAKHKVATPAGWEQGDAVIILPSLPDDEARRLFPMGWVAPRPYLRIVPQPV